MRLNHPDSYIDWLKTTPIFSNSELDHLPIYCIIIHDSLIIEHLTLLGYNVRNYRTYKIGATDPIEFLLIRDSDGFEFLLMTGLPGAGGISTQVAELASIGCKYFVHIGTCGIMGDSIDERLIIISEGSKKDQAAKLLSNDAYENSLPSSKLKDFFQLFLKEKNVRFQIATGVTIPIFYFQPVELIEPIVKSNKYCYVEMEQAPFFATCELSKVHGISLVVGSDKYYFENNELKHRYIEMDQNEAKNTFLFLVLEFFKSDNISWNI